MEINKSKNYGLYIDKLSKMGFETTKLEDDYGERLIDATFSISNDNGLAYDGSLLQTVLYKLTPYAIKINDLYPEEIRVNKESLIKVCLLHQIAKAVRLIKNDNEWERDKRGLLYKYDSKQPAIKTGMHSLVIAQNCGIPFTPEEAENHPARYALCEIENIYDEGIVFEPIHRVIGRCRQRNKY